MFRAAVSPMASWREAFESHQEKHVSDLSVESVQKPSPISATECQTSLAAQLAALAARPEIQKLTLSTSATVAALQAAGGKLHVAKRMCLESGSMGISLSPANASAFTLPSPAMMATSACDECSRYMCDHCGKCYTVEEYDERETICECNHMIVPMQDPLPCGASQFPAPALVQPFKQASDIKGTTTRHNALGLSGNQFGGNKFQNRQMPASVRTILATPAENPRPKVLSEAEALRARDACVKFSARADVIANGPDSSTILEVLKKNCGLVHPAKRNLPGVNKSRSGQRPVSARKVRATAAEGQDLQVLSEAEAFVKLSARADVICQAEALCMREAFVKLSARADVIAKGPDSRTILEALKRNRGLVHLAKRDLLGVNESKGRLRPVSVRKVPATAAANVDLQVLSEAEALGMREAFVKLSARADIIAKGPDSRTILKALKRSRGLVHPAKRDLLR